MKERNWIYIVLSLIFLLCIAKFVLLSFASLDFLLANTISDDAYYYLTIARNCCNQSFLFTFDRLHATNGFHFLYQVILIPFAPLFDTSLLASVHLLLFLNELFFLIGSLFLSSILLAYFSEKRALICLCSFMLATITSKIIQTGMETSLAYMIAMIFLWSVYVVKEIPAISGILLGLLFLARSDIGFLYIVTYLTWNAISLKTESLIERKKTKTKLFYSIITLSVVIGPLLIYYYIQFGHFSTISSEQKTLMTTLESRDNQNHFDILIYLKLVIKSSIHYLKEIFGRIFGDLINAPHYFVYHYTLKQTDMSQIVFLFKENFKITLLYWGFIIICTLFLKFLFDKLTSKKKTTLLQNKPLFATLILLPYVHFFLIIFIITDQASTWYWLLFFLALLLSGTLFARQQQYLDNIYNFFLLAVAFMGVISQPLFIISSGALSNDYRQTSWYAGPRDVSAFLNKNLTSQDRIGSFNAGLLGFLTTTPKVINLDGLVNNWELLEKRKNHQLREYIIENNIRYIADFKPWEKFLQELGFQANEAVLIYHSPLTDGFVVKLLWDQYHG